MKWKAEWLGCALYAIAAACFIANGPGYQYDEAILTHGAVYMLHGTGSPPFTREVASWLPIGSRALPLMAINYVGSVKDYLVLPLFALFGTSATVGRVVSPLMTLVMIWAVGRALRRRSGNMAAIAFGVTIAVQPSLLAATTLDSGCVGNWMLGLGLIVVATDQFVRSPDRRHAFWLGVAAGFAVWCRANCVWFLFALTAAAILIFRRELLRYLGKTGWIVAGGVVGGAPFLLFQIASRGAIFRFMHEMQVSSSDGQLIRRLRSLANVLVSSFESRQIWSGGAVPDWQWIAIGSFAAVSIVAAVVSRGRFARLAGLTAIVLGAIMLLTRMRVVDHHLVGLVPVIAAAAALAWCEPPRWRSAIGAAMFAFYVPIAVTQVSSSIRSLRATGGVDAWSDAVNLVAADPEARTAGILDWGLYNNLYVLTNGALQGRELFWGSTTAYAGNGMSWRTEIRRGGSYLVPAKRFFPQARAGFMRALAESRQSYTSRHFLQRNGQLYADLVRVTPR